MIKNLLTAFRDKVLGIQKLEYLLLEKMKKEIDFGRKEQKAIEILKPYFPKGFVFETGFSLNFQTIQHVANDIVANRPKTILEIGSGLSTLILDNLISELGYNPEFISIDQDSLWQGELRKKTESVDFYMFDICIKNEFSLDGKESWFDIPLDSPLRNKIFDLIIIDGPKGFESKNARYGILNFLKGKINESTILFLDDTNRDDEKFLKKGLINEFSFKVCDSYYNYSRFSFNTGLITSPS